MSHLDQAFIRAFAKDSQRPAPHPPLAPAAIAPTDSTIAEPLAAPFAAPFADFSTTYFVDEMCPAGTWHRVESPLLPQADLVIPAPHFELPPDRPPTPHVQVFSPASERIDEPDRPLETTRIDEPQARGLPAPHFGFQQKKQHVSPVETTDSAELSVEESPVLHVVSDDFVEPCADDTTEHGSRLDRALRVLAPAAKKKFAAVWEVDRFQWPALCDQALAAANDYFRDAGVRLRAAAHEGMRVLAVTSSQRGEGRTTVALSLARCAAAAGAHVALVDADLENPQLAAVLGLETSCGWEDVVVGDLPLAEAAVASLDDRIVLLPLTDDATKRSFALSDARVSQLLRDAADWFDLVIIDAPSLAIAERRLFEAGTSCPIDAAIVVRDLRHTSEEQALTAAARLRASGVTSVGIAENFVERG